MFSAGRLRGSGSRLSDLHRFGGSSSIVLLCPTCPWHLRPLRWRVESNSCLYTNTHIFFLYIWYPQDSSKQAQAAQGKTSFGKKHPELHRPANYTDQRACAHTPLPRDKRKTQHPTPHPSQNQPKTQSTNPRKNPSKGKPKEDPARTPGREEGEQLEQLQAAGKVAALEGSATNVGRIPLHELTRKPLKAQRKGLVPQQAWGGA